LPAAVTKVTTLRDRTVRLQVDCQEIPPEQMAEVFSLLDTLGWFFFHPKPIAEIDTKGLPEVKPRDGRTPSQRLRACLYVLWEQRHPDAPFEAFYEAQMERIIAHLKEQMDA
jgi:hypothetical protein